MVGTDEGKSAMTPLGQAVVNHACGRVSLSEMHAAGGCSSGSRWPNAEVYRQECPKTKLDAGFGAAADCSNAVLEQLPANERSGSVIALT